MPNSSLKDFKNLPPSGDGFSSWRNNSSELFILAGSK